MFFDANSAAQRAQKNITKYIPASGALVLVVAGSAARCCCDRGGGEGESCVCYRQGGRGGPGALLPDSGKFRYFVEK